MSSLAILILFKPVLLPIPNIHNSSLFCRSVGLILLLLPIVSSSLVKLILKSHSFKISMRWILDHLLFISCCNLIILSGSSYGSEGVIFMLLPTLLFLICTSLLLGILVFNASKLFANKDFNFAVNSLGAKGKLSNL